jgi:hypothetical protein
VRSAPARHRTSLRVRRRRAGAAVIISAVVVLGLVAAGLSASAGPGRSSGSNLPPLPSTTFRARLVEIAESQLGYRTDPPRSYCNKYSAYWGAGAACGHGLRAEEWCADFAAWVWRKGGVQFTYGYTSADINAAAGSFYLWALAHGTWHPVGSGYSPQPGDVAVYGLDPTTGTAAHVAIVTGYRAGARGPDVVNGDGDRTGFSVVEVGTDQYKADIPGLDAPVSGYASPIRPPGTHSSPQ